MSKGIYCLVFQNPAMELAVGRLGKLTLCEGWHIYVGSALGSGGLKRARRHIRLYQTKEGNAWWHVDSLLLSPLVTLSGIVYALDAIEKQKQISPMSAGWHRRWMVHR